MNKKLSKILIVSLVCLLMVCVSLVVLGCDDMGLSRQPTATVNFYMLSERVSYQIVSLNQVLKAPAVEIPDGYTLDGWYFDENEWTVEYTKSNLTTLVSNGENQFNVYARLKPTEYAISYENVKGADISSFATQYTIESETIALPDISADYYTFDGWYDGGTKVTEIAAGSFGEKTLTAKFTPINYTIAYKDTRNAANGNPATYNFDSGEITLSAVAKDGYKFEGWYQGETKATSIPANSHGDIELVAKWSIVDYTITYDSIFTVDTSEFPNAFTVESDNISIPTVIVDYYTFDGWYIGSQKVEEIATGSFGNKVLTAKFTPIDYTITYNGTKNAVNGNPAKYNVESSEITLAPIAKDGYKFEGWYQGETKVTSIPANSHGNVEFTAKWSLVNYSITYAQTFDFDTSAFPNSYTIESDAITLPESVTAICRIFKGWTLNGNAVNEIPTGTYGNLVLTATYDLDHNVVADAYVAPTCEATGKTAGSHCGRCHEVLVARNTIPALGHDYAASWEWDGYDSATVSLVCKHDSAHALTLDATMTKTTVQPTCAKEGTRTYIANVSYGGRGYSDVKTQAIETVPHNYVAIANNKEKHGCSMCNQLFDHVDTAYTGTCEQCEMKYADIVQIATSYNLVDVKLELDKIYVLTADITLDGTWAALGSSSQPFTGKFYGNGHTIKNLKIENTTGYGGLFAVNNGLIDGLTLENVTINSNAGSPATVICGGICAVNNGRITNCIIKGNSAYNSDNTQYNNDRDINYYGGLICGSNGKTGVIDSCQINGTVSNYIHVKVDARGPNMGMGDTYTVRSYVYYGNIAGENNGQINECVSNAAHSVRCLLEATGWRKADTGRAKITTYLGSLVGKNSGDVISCSAKASVITEKNESHSSVDYQFSYDIKQEPQYEGIVGVNSNGKIVGFEKLQ